MLTQEQVKECQQKFNLSYHVTYAKICQDLIGFEGKNVLEVGGSLPPDFVFDYLGVKSWTGIETPDYEKSLREIGGLTHQGTIIKEIKNIEDFKYKNKQQEKYNLYLENIEDLPENFYNQYDLIFSIATFEHIHKLPLALDKMFYALKDGGNLFSMFSPIWSAHDGHHLPKIKDQRGNEYNFGNSPISPWGHLLMSRGEMAEYLYKKMDKATADQIVYHVYQSNHINRYFTEDYLQIIERSLFKINKLELTFNAKIDSDLYEKLCSMYPKNKKFTNNGLLLSLEKEPNNVSLQKNQIQIKSQSLVKSTSNWQLTAPVAFIIFNRPDTTQKVFNAIREAKPPKLLVIADGARIDKEGEAELCQQTRAIIDQVDWDCEVLVNYSDVNLGCRKRVSSGLDWVFEQVEEAIILEDDCLPHPTFFRYCQELLEKYRDDERIMMISGDNFQFGRKRSEYSYYFSHYGHCWGWASWRRAWTKYDDSMQLWQELRDNNWLKDVLGNDQAVAYWSRIFQSVYDGFNSWAYIWQYTLWLNSGLTILPNVNLISNIGFGSGTHTTNTQNNKVANMAIESLSFPLNHPPFIIRNSQADNFTQENIFGTPFQPRNNSTLHTQKNKMSRENLLNVINAHKPISALNALNNIQETEYSLNYAKAVLLAKQGQITEALNHLDLLLAHSPSHRKGRHLKQEFKKNLSDAQIVDQNSLIDRIEQLLTSNQISEAFKILNEAKANKQPIQGLDYLRAKCFLQMKQPAASIQSLYEELRYFPDNHQAKLLLEQLLKQYPQFVARKINDAEFQELYQAIQPYTMLSEARLYSLFTLVKKICIEDIAGNFVECGVAGGGSTGLISALVKRYSKQPRIVYGFDSFEGMPTPTEQDKSSGIPAELTGWGTGTCSAPEDSVTEICQKLGSFDVVTLVKGYFEDTLPKMRDQLGVIAFLHMDGDWYSSTQAIINNLYSYVSPKGYIQIDDYGFWEGCRQAVTEFQQQNNLKFNLNVIDSTGVWFAKSEVTPLNPTLSSQQPSSKLKWLNLGCGGCFHPDWTNVDFNRTAETVIPHNLLKGIPFADNSFEVVYHSHLLEHLPKNEALPFLTECYRVLQPKGIIRVVIPDLEQIARLYLQSLENALNGSETDAHNYNWLMLEMYDQVVRNESGGDMKRYLAQNPLPNPEFIVKRFGVEGEMLIKAFQGRNFPSKSLAELNPTQIGQFRQGGEVHQWMYDRYSLKVLLEKVGFVDVKVCQANESKINGFNNYHLDVMADGKVRKSDSLFMEGIKH